MPVSPTLPAWLSEDDIRAYSEDFALHGDRAFTGAFNWYRNMELNNELLAPFRGRRVEAPALYVVGDRDMVTSLRGSDSGPSLAEMFRGGGGPGNPLGAVAPRMQRHVVDTRRKEVLVQRVFTTIGVIGGDIGRIGCDCHRDRQTDLLPA